MITGSIRQVLGRRWLAAGVAAISAVLVFHARFQLTIVDGESMLPTLKPGELLLVDRWAYRDREPHRDDIVVARNDAGLIVKRIVGLPGEELELKSGSLYINGTPHPENHGIEEGRLDIGKGKLREGDFATLGDNRSVSPVSAIHPIISKPDILGRVVFSSGRRM